MNSAKKIIKNNGVGVEEPVVTKKKTSVFDNANKVLIIIGLLAVLAGVFVVCYTQLRPRAILTVKGPASGGQEVTNTINYPEAIYDIYQAESMADMYAAYGMNFDWTETTENGDTYGDAYKNSIMDGMKQREILYMAALKNNMSLTNEEKEKAKKDVEEARKNMTDQQKKMKGLDEATMISVFEKNALGDKYKQSVIDGLNIDEEALKKTVSKKDYRQYTLQYYTFEKTETDDQNNTKEKDKATLTKAAKDMKELQKKAAKAKDFTKDIIDTKEGSSTDEKTGISYATKDLIETDTDFLDAKTLKVVKKMKNGEVSGVLETKDAYYVIKMVNNNDPAAYNSQCDSVIEQEKNKQFDTEYQNNIKGQYTAEVQSFWKGRVELGAITADTSVAQ